MSEEHWQRHKELHRALDELVADWIAHTNGLPSKASLLEFMMWSAEQMRCPTHQEEEKDDE